MIQMMSSLKMIQQTWVSMLRPVALSLLMSTLSSLHSRKELHKESPRVLAVLKFQVEVLDAIKREVNQDDMAILSLQIFGSN